MKNTKILQQLRGEAKELRLDYLYCKDVKKATILLRRWNRKMKSVHRLQKSINLLFSNELINETNTLSQISETTRENKTTEENVGYIQNYIFLVA